jgi:flagellar motility protein MotE (MotC chaperone)
MRGQEVTGNELVPKSVDELAEDLARATTGRLRATYNLLSKPDRAALLTKLPAQAATHILNRPSKKDRP